MSGKRGRPRGRARGTRGQRGGMSTVREVEEQADELQADELEADELQADAPKTYPLALRSISAGTPSLPPPSTRPSQRGSTSNRSRSPTKTVNNPIDLHLAQIPIEEFTPNNRAEIHRDMAGLWTAAMRISEGKGVIPRQGVDLIREGLGIRDPDLDNGHLTDEFPQSLRELDREFMDLQDIRVNTEAFLKELPPEVVWNEEVHSRFLAVALRVEPLKSRLRNKNVTTVDIHPAYLLLVAQTNTPCSTLQAKRVDYVVTLADEDTMTAARDLIRDKLLPAVDLAKPDQPLSVNHTEHPWLTERPVAISIETKASDGSMTDAHSQISVWAAGQMLRLRVLASQDPVTIPLPLLIVRGESWTLFYLEDQGHRMRLVRVVAISDSNSLVGCYKVIALVRAVAQWSMKVYRPWFWKHIFGKDIGESGTEPVAQNQP